MTPQNAVDALLIEGNPARVLTIINNLVIENPNTPLSPSALYIQALAHEFSGDRERARAFTIRFGIPILIRFGVKLHHHTWNCVKFRLCASQK